jgi:hypothetical protein
MHVGARLLFASVFGMAGLLGSTAMADRIDRVTTTVTPDKYDGPCPATFKLQGVVTFDVSRANTENFAYHWAAGDTQLTDDVKAFSKGVHNKVETSIQLDEPKGVTANIAIKLHAFQMTSRGQQQFFTYSRGYQQTELVETASQPATITITCR